MPRRKLSEQEQRLFVARRDRLFLLCGPVEQRCLIQCADWYGAHDPEILAKPNVFSESFLADFYYRILPLQNRKPNVIVRALAKVSGVISKVERWRAQRSQSSFTAHLRSLVKQGDEDVLLGVIHFLRVLPLEIGFDGQHAFEENLDLMSGICVGSDRVSATRRFDAVQRCILWPSEDVGLRGSASTGSLRSHIWRLLLAVAHEDMGATVRLIDEHWNAISRVLVPLHLHETPELAYQLAVKLKPYRVEFAVHMLRTSISDASSQFYKLDRPAITALEKVMGASCRLLADWTFGVPEIDTQNSLLSLGHLLRFGNPEDGYWRRVPEECLEVIKGLDPAEQDEQLLLLLLAQVTFYGDSSSSFVIEAHELFKTCVHRRIGGSRAWGPDLEYAISDVCRSLAILEDKFFSFRNRHIAACPDHPLLRTVAGPLQDIVERLLESEPSAALHQLVSLTLALSNETLIRKHHQILRNEFEVRARNCSADAGRALKKLIQYCGYSQVDDEMYRKELCRESFDALLPVLDGISPADAAVARSGIGWSPRSSNL